MLHQTVVDTSVVFPHKMGKPYKRALRMLAAEHLKRIIQNDGERCLTDRNCSIEVHWLIFFVLVNSFYPSAILNMF